MNFEDLLRSPELLPVNFAIRGATPVVYKLIPPRITVESE